MTGGERNARWTWCVVDVARGGRGRAHGATFEEVAVELVRVLSARRSSSRWRPREGARWSPTCTSSSRQETAPPPPGVAQLDVLLGRLVTVVGVFAVLRGFRLTLGPGQQRLPLVVDLTLAAAVAATMVVSFTVQAVPYGGDLLIDRGRAPAVAVFVTSFCLYLGWCFTAVLRGWRGLHRQPHLDARAGVQLTALAATAGLVHVASRLTGQLALLAGAPDTLVEATRQVCLATAVVAAALLTAGASSSGALTAARRLADEGTRAGHMVRLYPLWRDVVTAAPEVALTSPRFAPWRLLTGRTDFHRYRMVIEVLDGRSLLHARGHGYEAGGPANGSPYGDAMELVALLNDARPGARRPQVPAAVATATPAARSTVAAETAHLVAVATQYRRLSRDRRVAEAVAPA